MQAGGGEVRFFGNRGAAENLEGPELSRRSGILRLGTIFNIDTTQDMI